MEFPRRLQAALARVMALAEAEAQVLEVAAEGVLALDRVAIPAAVTWDLAADAALNR